LNPITAIVTGGSAGIGEDICRHFAQAGATVINVDRDPPARKEAGNYRFFRADLSDVGAAREVAVEIGRQFDVNCIINNVGTPTPGNLEDVKDDEFDLGVNLHVRTPLVLAQAFVPKMKVRRFGRIVHISSRVILGKKARTVYSATKAAMIGLTRSWALELGPFGITVNAIAPGPILTELFKKNNPPEVAKKLLEHAIVGRAGTPQDVSRAAWFLSDPENGYITGQVLHVCGGSSLTLNW
jgi:3-oxoacyl-[acyl-carrier protein] reductase